MWGSKTKELQKYGTDLTMLAQSGKLDPVIGREKEIELLIQSLLKRRNSNACLVGDAGVGKTAIVEALALKIAKSSVPMKLSGKKIVSIDVGRIVVDGGKNSGVEIEKRVKDVFEEVRESEGGVILFIDDVHNLIKEDGVASILKMALSKDDIKCIGTMTEVEYTRRIKEDKALKHMFETIQVREPSKEDCLKMLEGIIVKYQNHHGVKYTKKALISAVNLSKQYLREVRLPKNAINLIDKAGARAHMLGEINVTEKEIKHVVSTCTGVIVEDYRLLQLEDILKCSIIGQDEAVEVVCRSINRVCLGTRDGETKPIGSFMFCGPKGVGKTEMVRVLAEEYFGSERSIMRLDAHEFMDRHTVSRLVDQLAEEVRRRPHSLVLFDEIEKAHEEVRNVLVQILKIGKLNDGKGKAVDFSNTIVIVISNSSDALEVELVNTCIQVVAFKPLEKEHIKNILEIMIEQFCMNNKVGVIVSEELKESLVLVGHDKRYGAWAVKRAFARYIKTKMAYILLSGKAARGDTVKLDVTSTEIVSQTVDSNLSKGLRFC